MVRTWLRHIHLHTKIRICCDPVSGNWQILGVERPPRHQFSFQGCACECQLSFAHDLKSHGELGEPFFIRMEFCKFDMMDFFHVGEGQHIDGRSVHAALVLAIFEDPEDQERQHFKNTTQIYHIERQHERRPQHKES